MTLKELNQFFDTYNKVESRIYEVAHLCTDITSSETIVGFRKDSDGDIRVSVRSQDCGNDSYCFPLEYLAMTVDKIVEREKKKSEKARKEAEREAREERKRLERQERREYERLKKKYEGGAK
ncbi:MAG: hypothetical protein J6V72_04995 [Kiritimatiellae bacterium]|nr:hypothetical protein [Kiritimatiellia bacterium]